MAERFGELIRPPEAEEGREKHVPVVEAPARVRAGEEFEVRVAVGTEVPHPNTVEHHIKWIQVFVEEEGRPYNPIHVATFDLGPSYGEPKVSFRLKLKKSSKIWALSYCNLHGLWEGSRRVEVEEASP